MIRFAWVGKHPGSKSRINYKGSRLSMNGEAKRESQISLIKFRFVDETVNDLLLVRRGPAL